MERLMLFFEHPLYTGIEALLFSKKSNKCERLSLWYDKINNLSCERYKFCPNMWLSCSDCCRNRYCSTSIKLIDI